MAYSITAVVFLRDYKFKSGYEFSENHNSVITRTYLYCRKGKIKEMEGNT